MEYEDKIYKKSSLEDNDSISVYNGWGAQQNYKIFEVLHHFLNEIKPKQILEIGTSIGGLTTYIDYVCKKLNLDTKFISYDILEYNWYQDMRNNGIDVRVENVFYDDYKDVKQEVIDFIRNDGTTLILCDGGNKIGEFNLLSDFMKSGDFIMAHDYAENDITFKNDIYMKIWNWHEISDKDIESACVRNNLRTYNKDIFDKVVWVCKIKD
jgi:hypothetical protein